MNEMKCSLSLEGG